MKPTAIALFSVALAQSGLVHAAARVSSNSDCPSADAIGRRLLGLVATGGPEAASARVLNEGETLRIELSATGEAAQERTLPATGECEERAEMAALVIAAWLDVMPAGTVRAPGVPPRDPGPRTARSGDVVGIYDPENPPISVSTRTLVGVAWLGFADSLGSAAGLTVDAAMPNLVESFGLVAEASLSLPRELAVGQGVAHYWRPTFMLGGSGEVRMGKWALRPQGCLALGVLAVHGTGYQADASATTLVWGASVGVRTARPWRKGELWLRVDGVTWPQGRTVLSKQTPSGPDLEAPLSQWELRLAVGFSWAVPGWRTHEAL